MQDLCLHQLQDGLRFCTDLDGLTGFQGCLVEDFFGNASALGTMNFLSPFALRRMERPNIGPFD
jgi:hypothetical protein